jgi:polyketide biosynthesis acyl carrier protein
MSERRVGVRSGLAGFLLVAAVGVALGPQGMAWISPAQAQALQSDDEGYEDEDVGADDEFAPDDEYGEGDEAPSGDDSASWDTSGDMGDAEAEGAAGDAKSQDGVDASSEEEEEAESDSAQTENTDEPGSAEPETAASPVEGAAETPNPTPSPAAVQSPPASETKEQRAFRVITEVTRKVISDLEGHRFQATDRLLELGANSVDRAEIRMLAMERLGVEVSHHEFAHARSIGELAQLLAAKLP